MKAKTHIWGIVIGLLLISLQSVASDRIWIQWDACPESDLNHYVIYRSDASKAQPDLVIDQLAVTEASFYIDENVELGTTYYYWVSAVDEVGNASITSEPLVVVFDATYGEGTPEQRFQSFMIEHVDEDQYPTDPFVNRAIDNDNKIEFTWSSLSNDDVHFVIYLSLNDGPDAFASETEESYYAVGNAASGETVRLRVDVIDANDQLVARGFSDVIRCEIIDTQIIAPETPKVLDLE